MTASSTLLPGRRLGLFEQFVVSKANINCPSTVVFLATFPPPAVVYLTPARVKQAIVHLAREHPLLRCAVSAGRTQDPHYALSDEVNPDAVLERVADCTESEVELLSRLANNGMTFNGSRGPLWRVSLFEQPAGEGSSTVGVRLGLAISHVLADGTASRNLFQQLLSVLHPDSPHDLASPRASNDALPPSFEATVGVKLKLPAILRLVRDEIILPKLAPLLPKKTRLVPISGKYAYQPIQTALFRVPAEQVARLKAVASEHGLKTLHPLLQGSVLAACYLASSKTTSKRKPGVVKSLTPITLRDPAKGHPTASGNYISALNAMHSLSAATSFFDLCRAYQTTLNSATYRKRAVETMLSLGLLPSTKPKPCKELGGKPATGMDRYLLDYREGRHIPDGDVAVSNLQVLQPTGWETTAGFAVGWAQSTGPYEMPLCVNVLTLKGGPMMVSINWIGGALEDGRYAERFIRAAEEIIAAVAAGDAVKEVTTLELLRR